jgi:hypothetical protein
MSINDRIYARIYEALGSNVEHYIGHSVLEKYEVDGVYHVIVSHDTVLCIHATAKSTIPNLKEIRKFYDSIVSIKHHYSGHRMVGLFASRKPCTERHICVLNALRLMIYFTHIIKSNVIELADAVVDYILNDVLRKHNKDVVANNINLARGHEVNIEEDDKEEDDKEEDDKEEDDKEEDDEKETKYNRCDAADKPDIDKESDTKTKYDKYEATDEIFVGAAAGLTAGSTTGGLAAGGLAGGLAAGLTAGSAAGELAAGSARVHGDNKEKKEEDEKESDTKSKYDKYEATDEIFVDASAAAKEPTVLQLIDDILLCIHAIKNNSPRERIDEKYNSFDIEKGKYEQFMFNEIQGYLYQKCTEYSSFQGNILYNIYDAYVKIVQLYDITRSKNKIYMKKWKLDKRAKIKLTLENIPILCTIGVDGIFKKWVPRYLGRYGHIRLLALDNDRLMRTFEKLKQRDREDYRE